MLNKFSEVCTVVVIPDEILEEPLALPMEDIEETPASEDEIEDVIVDEDEEIIDEEDSEVVDEESDVIDEEDSEVADEESEVIDEEESEVTEEDSEAIDEEAEVIDNSPRRTEREARVPGPRRLRAPCGYGCTCQAWPVRRAGQNCRS